MFTAARKPIFNVNCIHLETVNIFKSKRGRIFFYIGIVIVPKYRIIIYTRVGVENDAVGFVILFAYVSLMFMYDFLNYSTHVFCCDLFPVCMK